MAVAYAPQIDQEAAYQHALRQAPLAPAEHRIVRLDYTANVRPIGEQRHTGTPYQQGETARSLQLRVQCIKAQALQDPAYWIWLEAHRAGGRVLAQGRWSESGAHYHVAVIEAGGYARPLAFQTRNGVTEYVKDSRLLTTLQDDLLYDECDDAVYREMQRRGIGHLVDEWPMDTVVRRAMDGVIECAWDPARAAEWAVDLEIEMQEEGV